MSTLRSRALRRTYLLVWASSFALVCALSSARAQSSADDFLGIDALSRGDVGYMLTVLEDSEVERLAIEILSVERGFAPKSNVIWARGTDETFKRLGVASGMSGSPVYVGGRLIGACAYTYSFSREPILGITPIAQMVTIWARNMTPSALGPRSSAGGRPFNPFPPAEEWSYARAHPHGLTDTTDAPVISDEVARRHPELDVARGMALRRIATPLMLRGFGAAARGIMDGLFADRGFVTVPAAGGGSAIAKGPVKVEGGTTIGIEYVRGDMSAFAYGTVTYREGDRILAFGHPMFGEGDTHLPMSAGMIHFVLANQQLSFKVGSATDVVGTLLQDRETGIAGVLDDEGPPYLPMTVRLRTRDNREGQEFRYWLLRHRLLTGGLAMSVASVTLSSAEKSTGEYAIAATATVEFGGPDARPALIKKSVLSGRMAPSSAAASMLSPVSLILNNWYDDIEIESIRLDLDYREAYDVGAIESARLDRERVRPGGVLPITVRYRPFLEEPVTETYRITVPKDAEEGYAMVFVGDSGAYESWERSRAPERYQPSNADQMLELLSRGGSQRELRMSVVTAKMGVAVKGTELPSLPLSVLSVMTPPLQDGDGQATRGSILTELTRPTPFVVQGSTLLPFFIDSNASLD